MSKKKTPRKRKGSRQKRKNTLRSRVQAWLLAWLWRTITTHKRIVALGLLICIGGLATSCVTSPPPQQMANLCEMFDEKSSWYEYANRTYYRWGIPISVQMAIMRQESSFISDAKPPRTMFLGIIPLARPSSAFGYAQALDGSWDLYRSKTGQWNADRDNFADTVDFIGWYCDVTHRTLGISKWDAKRLYLAYHEGQGGYRQRSYQQKPWLMPIAQKVERNAQRYSAQLKGCEQALKTKRFFWPFS